MYFTVEMGMYYTVDVYGVIQQCRSGQWVCTIQQTSMVLYNNEDMFNVYVLYSYPTLISTTTHSQLIVKYIIPQTSIVLYNNIGFVIGYIQSNITAYNQLMVRLLQSLTTTHVVCSILLRFALVRIFLHCMGHCCLFASIASIRMRLAASIHDSKSDGFA